MAASVIAAVLDKYDTLTLPGSPPCFFDQIPATDGNGAQLYPPFVVLEDDGLTPTWEFERHPFEETRLTFRVYALGLDDADAIVEGIKYGGAMDVTEGRGFDFGTLPTLDPDRYLKTMVRTRERRYLADRLDRQGRRVHACDLEYSVRLNRRPVT